MMKLLISSIAAIVLATGCDARHSLSFDTAVAAPITILTKVIAPSPAGRAPLSSPFDVLAPFVSMSDAIGVFGASDNIDGYFVEGDTLHAVRVLVQDNPSPGGSVGDGNTRLVSSLKGFHAPNQAPSILGVSKISDGSGVLQTLPINGLSELIGGSGVTHSVQTAFASGSGTAFVWSIEVDYIPR